MFLRDRARSLPPGGMLMPGSGDMAQPALIDGNTVAAEVVTEVRRKEALIKTGALQDAIFNSANFSSIATDEKGVIQIFNVGAERMLGYAAAEVLNKITPADISDPQEAHRARRGLERRARDDRSPRASRPWYSRRRAGSRTSTS